MIRCAAFFALLVLPAFAKLNIHPVERLRLYETEDAVFYNDRMSDGTIRESQIRKPRQPSYPERVSIVETNETAAAWQLVYSIVWPDGSSTTNFESVVKTDKLDRLVRRPAALPPPPDRLAKRDDALAATLLRARKSAAKADPKGPVKEQRMGPNERTVFQGGEIVKLVNGKEVSRSPARRAFTARVQSAPINQEQQPESNSTAPIAGAVAAGVAAGAGAVYLGLKRPSAEGSRNSRG
jgi:hypothetical protein